MVGYLLYGTLNKRLRANMLQSMNRGYITANGCYSSMNVLEKEMN